MMDQFDAAGVTGMIWRRIQPGREGDAEAVMRDLMAECRRHAGYLGSEIFPPIADLQDAYVVLYRFDTGKHLRAWLASPERMRLLQSLEAFLREPTREVFFSHRRQQPGTISSVFSYRIRPGCEERFHEWRRRIFEAARVQDGFIATESFDAFDSGQREFVVVVRFDNREHLDAWLNSRERAGLIDEVHDYVEDFRLRRVGTGFEGWFDYGPDSRPPAPWRQGLVILAALFPLIMTLRALLAPLFEVFPFPVAFLILLAVDVTVLTYVIMPKFSQVMNFWLRPRAGAGWWSEIAGWAILLGLIGGTLAVALAFGG